MVKMFNTMGLILAGCMTLMPSADAQTTNAIPMASAPVASSVATTPSDKTLARNVRRALSKAPNFSVFNVFVKARSGVVTLSGSVPDGHQIQQASEVAASVAGVRSVENHLTIYTKGY